MTAKLTLGLLLATLSLEAQDIILMNNGADLNVKIIEVKDKVVSYNTAEQNAFPYYMAKTDIAEIRFANGKTEKITHPEITLDQAKNAVQDLVNSGGVFLKDGQELQASFEERFLLLSPKNGKPGQGDLYDFTKVIRFDQISFRRDKNNDAFINIWVTIQTSPKSNSWDKSKMVLRLESHEKAVLLFDALTQLNKALLRNR